MKTITSGSITSMAAKGLWTVTKGTAKLCFAVIVLAIALFIKIVDDIYVATYPK